ncbi:MAG: hypothetical protein B7Z55_19865 [Planctomycetales bacterium 12-60-4]|nr:MAG: hypothetical protein B7Z55_19865 [Planctomycetales bacterium 12-60-4]
MRQDVDARDGLSGRVGSGRRQLQEDLRGRPGSRLGHGSRPGRVAYQVHERPNGYGYPRAKSGDRIHLFARILAVADAYSALTSTRPQRPALTPYAAMECVVKMARRKDLDPEIVRALLKVLTLFPIGSYVALSDARLARVIRRNGDRYTTPIVQAVQDAEGNPIPHDQEDAILDLSEGSISIVQALPTPGTAEIELTDEILTVRRPRL